MNVPKDETLDGAVWLYLIIGWGILCRIVYSFMSVDIADHYANIMTALSMRDCLCIPLTDMFGTAYIYRPPSSHFWMALFMPYPKIAIFLFGILMLVLTFLIGRRLNLSKRDSLLSVAICSVIPIAVSLSSMNSLDIFTGVYILAGLYFWLRGKLVAAAVFAALAILSKYDGVVFFIGVTAYLLYKRRFKDMLLFGIIVLLIVSPWFLTMWQVHGNPVYPYFDSWFGNTETLPTGEHVHLINYLLGAPLSLFGVPEGNYDSLAGIATSFGIPLWAVLFVCTSLMLILLLCIYGIFKFVQGLDRSNQEVIIFFMIGYLSLYAARLFVPLGSMVSDLRYGLGLIPLIALGITRLDRRILNFILILFILGCGLLSVRYWVAIDNFQVYEEALEFIKTLPADAVILAEGDSSIYSYGIEYKTGRLAFPLLGDRNSKGHIPFIFEKYDSIRARGPNYLWSTSNKRVCDNLVFKNNVVTICDLNEKLGNKTIDYNVNE